ncbi:MAG TPA: M23 family metallopeptidase [Rhizomicrobium sp.]|jgi:murein DD-endopeptidase MepM/ murein hydrolase activator NlpD|nr:M23 family metallopeptidase [Rhizomicrobium sp.]
MTKEAKSDRTRWRLAALCAFAPFLLTACATSPDTTFNWGTASYAHPSRVVVRRGDTVSDIANRYRVTTNDILARNGLRSTRSIYPGQVLVIPADGYASNNTPRRSYAYQGTSHRRIAVARNTPQPSRHPAWYASATPRPAPVADVQAAEIVSAPVHFAWPLHGSVITPFGTNASGGRNDGINIATAMDAPIHAAASGTVVYAGNEIKGYGNLVLIRHDDGYVTAYAHADSISVGKGQRVEKGQTIGYAGQTGDVAAPQLHFEIRHGVRPVDPKPLLMASN